MIVFVKLLSDFEIILLFIFISRTKEKNTKIKKDEKSEPKVIRNEQLLNKFKTFFDRLQVFLSFIILSISENK